MMNHGSVLQDRCVRVRNTHLLLAALLLTARLLLLLLLLGLPSGALLLCSLLILLLLLLRDVLKASFNTAGAVSSYTHTHTSL